jgi:hypothetical protein
LANEAPRETLIQLEQLGSALSDDVVSPIIRHVNYQRCKTDRIEQSTAKLAIASYTTHVARQGSSHPRDMPS